MEFPSRFGKYELLEHLATGGMAEVFLARSLGEAGFEKRVVIKRILPAMARNPRFVSMFVKEARITAGLSHPNVVQIYDLGKHGMDHYIAMEHIHGRDLTALIRALRKNGERIPIPLAVYISANLLRGLDYAHSLTDSNGVPLNLVHRDVSPHNLMVSFQGEVKLFDFGIARLVGGGLEPVRSRGRPGGGKFAYMSPEQASGEELDRRSDIFSAGIVLYEMLVGHRLFRDSDPAEKLRRVREAEVPDPRVENPDIPDELWALLSRMLQRSPDDRPETAGVAEEGLWAFLFTHGLRADAAAVRAFLQDVFPDAQARRPGSMDLAGLRADLGLLDQDRRTVPDPSDPQSGSLVTRGDSSMPHTQGTGTDGVVPALDRLRASHGERKSVCVLVVEVVGFTDLSARREPEEIVRRHLRFLRRVRRSVGRYGGLLESYQDDTLVIFFGVPRTDEHDLECALACARDLQQEAQRMARRGLSIDLCIGVHRGDVTVGARSKRGFRYLARGDTMKLARRMCLEADLGQVLVSSTIEVLARAHHRFAPAVQVRLKGRSESSAVFRLIGERRAAEVGVSGRWLARGNEVESLASVMEALGSGRGGVVSLSGAAGVGKTRLLREFAALAGPRGLPLYRARATPYGADRSLSSLRELVGTVLGLEAGASTDVVRERLGRLAQLGLDERERARIASLFAVHLAERGVVPQANNEMRHAAVRLVRGLATESPVILAVEDVQHLPDVDLALLGHIVRSTAGQPVVFLFSCRTELPAELGEPRWRVQLDRLSPHTGRGLLRELIGATTLSDELVARIDRDAEGNPLYMEALVDALQEGGRIDIDAGHARLVEGGGALDLPVGLDGLIAARVDALEVEQKSALQVAAMIGTRFSGGLLAAALDLPDATTLLGVLAAHGLIVIDDGGASCTFSSTLIWDAVHRTIPARRGRDLHGMVADGMARLYADRLDPHRQALARHNAAAGRFLEASRHADLAGVVLERQQLFEEAARCWEQAIAWVEEADGGRRGPSADEAWLRYKAGACWAVVGQGGRSETHLQVALEIASEEGVPEVEGRAHLELGRRYRAGGSYLVAAVHFEAAVGVGAVALDRPSPPSWARSVAVEALEAHGQLSHDTGDLEAAGRCFERARELAGDDDRLAALAMLGLAARHIRVGAHREALALLEEAQVCARASGDRILLGRVVNNVGIVHHGARRYADALDHFRRAIEIRQGIGYLRGVTINLHNVGDTHLRMGDRARAWASFVRSTETAEAMGWKRGVNLNVPFLAYIEASRAVDRGGAVDGRPFLERIRECGAAAEALHDVEISLTAQWLLGRTLGVLGRIGEARACLDGALSVAQREHAHALEEDVRAALGELPPPP